MGTGTAMEVKSSTVTTIGEVPRAVLTAVSVFIFLKTFEFIVRKLMLRCRPGRLSPQVWARSVLLSEAWNPNALLRLLLGRTRYDSKGGVKVVERKASGRNIGLLAVFIVTVMVAEVMLMIGALESEKAVRADSIKVQFRHTGKVAGSESVRKKGCQWADVQGQNFQLTAPMGVCWAEGNGDSEGFVVGRSSPTSQFFVKQYDSAVYIEVNTPLETVDLVTKAYLASIIVSSSGLSSRVRMENDTANIIKGIIEQHAFSYNCQIVPGDAPSRTQAIANSSFTEIKGCDGGIANFSTVDNLLDLISGGFSLVQGTISPWDGNIRSKQGSASENVIGVETRSRLGLVALLLITLVTLLLRLGLHFLPGDNENIAMKIVMERIGGNYCTEDPTACDGEEIYMVASVYSQIEENSIEEVGYVGTSVPDGYTEVDDKLSGQPLRPPRIRNTIKI